MKQRGRPGASLGALVVASLAGSSLMLQLSIAQAEPLFDGDNAAVAAKGATPSVSVDFVGFDAASDLDAKIASWFLEHGSAYVSKRRERFHASELFTAHTPGVHVFVLRTRSDQLRLWFVSQDGTGRRYLVRDVALSAELDEVDRENVAQVVFSASIALWEGREETPIEQISAELAPKARQSNGPASTPAKPAARRESADPSAVVPEAAARNPTSSRQVSLVSSAGYAFRHRGPAGVGHGPLLALGLATRFPRELGARVSGTLIVPLTLERRALRLELSGYSLAWEAWIEVVRESEIQLAAALAMGVDIVRASPAALTEDAITPAKASRSFDPFVAPRAGASFDTGSLRVGIVAELAVQVVRRHYDVLESDTRRPWIEAWRVQPGLIVQAGWTVP